MFGLREWEEEGFLPQVQEAEDPSYDPAPARKTRQPSARVFPFCSCLLHAVVILFCSHRNSTTGGMASFTIGTELAYITLQQALPYKKSRPWDLCSRSLHSPVSVKSSKACFWQHHTLLQIALLALTHTVRQSVCIWRALIDG